MHEQRASACLTSGRRWRRSLRRISSRALKALLHGYLAGQTIDGLGAGTVDFFATELTERGRRAVGLWPSGESADALVEALRQAEELTDDPKERTLIRRSAGAIGSVSREVLVDGVAAVVARRSGLGSPALACGDLIAGAMSVRSKQVMSDPA
jgi:hypothetical protein